MARLAKVGGVVRLTSLKTKQNKLFDVAYSFGLRIRVRLCVTQKS